MSAFSTASYFSRDTNATITTYAKAAVDTSYYVYNNMSWSFWHAGQPGTNKNIWSMWDESTNKRSWLFSNQTDGTFRIIFSHDGTGISANYKTTVASMDFSWKHYFITFASGTFQVYINNVLQTLSATTTWTAGAVALHAADKQILVGAKNPAAPGADQCPGGCFSNFSIWNKVLSSAERTELYHSGRPGNLATHSAYANCTNWWRMDQSDNNSLTTLADTKTAGAAMTITKTGADAVFNPSGNYPKVEDVPSVASVLSGVSYDCGDLTGTLNVGASVWDATTSSYTTAGSFGSLVQKLLKVSQFLGLK